MNGPLFGRYLDPLDLLELLNAALHLLGFCGLIAKTIDKDFQLATAIAMFGMKLRESKYLGNTNWTDIETIALSTYSPGDYLQKEFVGLVDVAKKLYTKTKSKKKKKEQEEDD